MSQETHTQQGITPIRQETRTQQGITLMLQGTIMGQAIILMLQGTIMGQARTLVPTTQIRMFIGQITTQRTTATMYQPCTLLMETLELADLQITTGQ